MVALHLNEILHAVNGTAIWLNTSSVNQKSNNPGVLKVGTNSKESLEQGLFVPVIGERVDAHDFIKSAFLNGAIFSFTSRHHSMEDVLADDKINDYVDSVESQGKALIVVENTLTALQQLATYYRSKYDTPVIGISGSVGKTTTKEMISAALETKLSVLKTFGNMNSQIGVSLMMFELDPSHDVAVIEMGISEPHEMERLCSIARPNYAVLTNIGVSHIANLKTQENIRKEKSKIVNAFGSDSVLYVNGNDELLEQIYREDQNIKSGEIKNFTLDLDTTTKEMLLTAKVCSFGTNEGAIYRATDIQTIDEKTSFQFVYPGGTQQVLLNVCGIHYVYNALVALALALEFGIEPAIAKKGLESYTPIKMRGEIKNFGEVKVIDDTYNASPDSMKSGINVLTELSDVDRRIAILADVLELGEMSEQCHYGVGEYLTKTKVDVLITVGSQAKFIAKAVSDNNQNIITYSFDKNEEANEFLKGFVQKRDGILVKGSRGMHTEQIVEFLDKEFN